jgi:Na+:H+ antiporter, NhaA family
VTDRASESEGGGASRGLGKLVDPLTEFLHEEAAGGVALAVATILALLWANGPADQAYVDFWNHEIGFGVGDLDLNEDLRHWVNDGLMVVFFFVVGLEIKRELVTGELRRPGAASLPAVAAIGGVVLPALIFVAITAGAEGASGWAIPAATDIAFAVGVMALLGDRVSSGVKLLLLTIAIVDDVIAIVLIAIFYSEGISPGWLAAAVAVLLGVVALRRVGVWRIAVYVPVGFAAWLAMHESGVHATIAGVALGLLCPARPVRGREVLATLEHRLHPVSAFVVVPLFALANAGIDLRGGNLQDAVESRVAWAIAAGLVVGKLLGITSATLLALRRGWGDLPEGAEPRHVAGVAALGGIGFTVSLFIAQLAYEGTDLVNTAKVGILAGSLVSGILGAALLLRSSRSS